MMKFNDSWLMLQVLSH